MRTRHHSHKFSSLAALLCGLLIPLVAPAAKPTPPPAVSVSAANYAKTPWDELRRRAAERGQFNPATPSTEPLATPQTYVFAPGELYESDVPYAEICRQLESALALKGYRNAADTKDHIARPDKIDLILRISSGGREWRMPTVRTVGLTWRQGLVNLHRTTRHIGRAENIQKDYYAGGDDDALSMAAAAQSSSAGSGLVAASQGSVHPGLYEGTRDFFLLVVDAFSYQELLEKQAYARRQWTTFIALPREKHDSFAAVLPTMLKVATPYFGETTTGLQVFNDSRASVNLGELQILDSDVKPSPEKNK